MAPDLTPQILIAVAGPAVLLVWVVVHHYQPSGLRSLVLHLVGGLVLTAPLAGVLMGAAKGLPGLLHPLVVLSLGQIAIAYLLLVGYWVLRAGVGAVIR
jgi:hypothetical protein